MKRLLAILIAGAMAMTLGVAAFADQATSGDFTGDGDTTYIATDVYSVLLPTTLAWDFILDPQGLVGAYRSGTVGSENALASATPEQLAPFAGKIIPGTAFPVVQNRSSYDVALSVDIKVTGDAVVVASASSVSPASGEDGATANNVLLEVDIATAAITSNIVETAVTTFPASTVSQTLDDKGKSLSFVLGAANYVFSATGTPPVFSYARNADSFGNGTALQLSGEVNKNADWSAFVGDAPTTKKVGIDAKFTIAKATEEDVAIASVDGAYGFKGVGMFTAKPTAAAALTGGMLTVTITAAGDYTFPAESLTSFKGVNAAGNTVTFANMPAITRSSGNAVMAFTLAASWGTTGANAGWTELELTFPSYVVVVTKASAAATTATVEITLK
ncbi:MAG: hypothetical protein FWD34_01815 [Oscillospiraceae bacterium]|nr:hypothetical protein [Oscillospiraceae bacterium]